MKIPFTPEIRAMAAGLAAMDRALSDAIPRLLKRQDAPIPTERERDRAILWADFIASALDAAKESAAHLPKEWRNVHCDDFADHVAAAKRLLEELLG